MDNPNPSERTSKTNGQELFSQNAHAKLVMNNSANIAQELYDNDIANYDKAWEDNLPIGLLPFPVEHYDTPGNGLIRLRDTIDGVSIAGNSISIGKEEESFFNILVKTNVEKPLSYSSVSSRNHPSYIGQGIIKHSLGNIDWLAIRPENQKGYAVVSGRIFDLEKGKTIFVFQDTAKGIDFIQIDDSVNSTEEKSVKNYMNRIKTYNNVVQFISKG